MHKKYRYRKRFLSFLAASLLVPVLVMSVPMSDVKADRTTFNTIWQTIFSGDRDEIEALTVFTIWPAWRAMRFRRQRGRPV